jgi:hypothetical protein
VDAYLLDAVRTPFGRHHGGPGTATAGNSSPVGPGTAMVVRVDG